MTEESPTVIAIPVKGEHQLIFTDDFRKAVVIAKSTCHVSEQLKLNQGLRIRPESEGTAGFLVEEGSAEFSGDIVIPADTATPGVFDVRFAGNRIDLIGFGVSDLLDGVLLPQASLKAYGRFDFQIETSSASKDEFRGVLIRRVELSENANQAQLKVKVYFQSAPPERA